MIEGKLILIRHGQTADNIARLDTGQNDVPLTDLGERQVRVAGGLIRDFRFDKVFSSPLSRAFNTAVLALEASGTQDHLRGADGAWQVEKRAEIIEQDDGVLTGRSMEDPVVVDYFKHSVFDGAPPGGESDKNFVARVRKFFDEEVAPRLARGETVLVTAHTGTIRAFDMAMGLAPVPADGQRWKNRRPVPNAGPDVYEFEDGVLKKTYALENPLTTKTDKELKEKRQAEKNAAPPKP